MRIHLLVEGPSEAAFLVPWLARFQPAHKHVVIHHEGKGRLSGAPDQPPDPKHRGLLDQLPAKLRAYGKSLDAATDRVLVLVDADTDSCVELKRRLVDVWQNHCDPRPHAMFRVAVEETEAFFLGDERALRRSFSKFKRAEYAKYTQDSICGTWEVLQAVIAWPHEAKVKWAQEIGQTLGTEVTGPAANRSPSFVQFCRALRALAGEPFP